MAVNRSTSAALSAGDMRRQPSICKRSTSVACPRRAAAWPWPIMRTSIGTARQQMPHKTVVSAARADRNVGRQNALPRCTAVLSIFAQSQTPCTTRSRRAACTSVHTARPPRRSRSILAVNGDLRPENTVVLVIDMQTDFCGYGGYVDKIG